MTENQLHQKLLTKIKDLEKKEIYYNLIIQNSQQSIILIQDGKIKFANAYTLKILGYTLKEIRAVSFANFIHPDDQQSVLKYYSDRMQGNEAPLEYECRVLDKNKNEYWIKTSVSIIFWNKKPAVVNFIKDISQEKQLKQDSDNYEQQLVETEKKYRDFFKFFPETLFETNLEGKMTFVNQKGFDLFDYKKEDIIKGKYASDMLIPEDREKGISVIKSRLLGTMPFIGIEYTGISSKGKTFPIIVYSDRIIENNKVVGIRGLVFDISDQKRKEKQLKLQNDSLVLINAINNAINEGATIYRITSMLNIGTKEIFINNFGVSVYLMSLDGLSIKLYNTSISNKKEYLLNKKDEIILDKKVVIKKVFNTNRVHVIEKPKDIINYLNEFDFDSTKLLCENNIVSVISIPLIANDRVIGIMDLFCDHNLMRDEIYSLQTIAYQLTNIIKRKLTETELKEREENYKLLLDNSPVGILIHDGENIQFVNKTIYKILNVPSKLEKKLLHYKFTDIIHPDHLSVVKARIELIKKGETVPFIELKIVDPFNPEIIIEIEATISIITFNGNKVYQSIFRDLTLEKSFIQEKNKSQLIKVSNELLKIEIEERIEIENQLKTSLQEKEILFKEVHHRVKNNMQVISSILSLQSRTVEQKEIKRLFEESQDRIKSMALIHENLYRSKDLTKIDFKEYIQTLTSSLYRTYNINSNIIKLELDLDQVFINLDNGISCGLIINELISNSLKYAFENKEKGCMFVMLKKLDESTIYIVIRDDGKGFEEIIDFETTESLGLQIVNTLVEQINGTIKVESKKDVGTKFSIQFTN